VTPRRDADDDRLDVQRVECRPHFVDETDEAPRDVSESHEEQRDLHVSA
jgi:hypothetical protein